MVQALNSIIHTQNLFIKRLVQLLNPLFEKPHEMNMTEHGYVDQGDVFIKTPETAKLIPFGRNGEGKAGNRTAHASDTQQKSTSQRKQLPPSRQQTLVRRIMHEDLADQPTNQEIEQNNRERRSFFPHGKSGERDKETKGHGKHHESEKEVRG